MEYPTCHLYFLGIHTPLKARVYTEKIQVTRGIFHSIRPLLLNQNASTRTHQVTDLKHLHFCVKNKSCIKVVCLKTKLYNFPRQQQLKLWFDT